MKQALFATLLLFSITASAETVFIKDELRVGVRTQPNSNEPPIAVVITGAALEVLEKQGGYLRVRTEKGITGWINQLYASPEKPARVQNVELLEEQQQLNDKIRVLEEALSSRDEQNVQLNKAVDSLRDENAKLLRELEQYRVVPEEESSLWLYTMGVMLLLFIGGIFLGVKWHRDRVAQRLGGIEI